MTKKSMGTCVLLLCLSLLTSGCSTTASANTPLPIETKTEESQNTTISLGGKELEIEYDAPAAYVLDYPTFENPAINTQIEDFMKERKTLFASQHTPDTANQANLTQMDCHAFLYIAYESYLLDPNLLSVTFLETQEDTLENTSQEHTYTLYFQMDSGERVLEDAIIKANFYETLSAFCINYFTTDEMYASKLYGDYATTLAPNSEVLHNFTLTNDGVRIYFEPYVLFPKSVGKITLTIPYDFLKGTLSFLEEEEIVPPQEAIIPNEEVTTPEETTSKLQQPTIRELDPTKPMVALTYDDGPSQTHTSRILDTLELHGAVATFFDLGSRVESYPEVVQRELALGCEVGSHSYSHKNFNTLSAEEITEDFSVTAAAFERAIGVTPTLFRPPYGNCNSFVKSHTPLAIVTWSVDTLDWKSKDPQAIMNVIKNEGSLDGKVILMHGIYETSAEATELLVPYLLENGYQFVTISEMLHYKHDATAASGTLYGYQYFS